MKIINLQNNFIEHLYSTQKPDILQFIKDGKAPKVELFDIYRNNLQATFTSALRLTYPKVYKFLGVEKFNEYAKSYIENNRSASGNLDDYGENFLQNDANFLTDLAKLEWLEQKSYLALNCGIINIIDLQNLPQERLFDVKFKVNSSCFCILQIITYLRRNCKIKLKNEHYII